MTVAHDAPVLDLDPGAQLVGESEGVGLAQRLEVVDHLGQRRVVVGDAHVECQLGGQPLHRLRGDPRDRGDRGFDAHVCTVEPGRRDAKGGVTTGPVGLPPPEPGMGARLTRAPICVRNGRMPDGRITVFLADDNLIVREGVRALLGLEPDIEIVGTAADYDELVKGATDTHPQVVVTDIRMPPSFQREGIDAAKEVRKRHPGTGVVVLSQYDEPEYAISLLGEGAAGYAYLLKDRVAEGDQLARAVREVATGGSMLDPKIVEALVTPVTGSGELSNAEEDLLRLVAEGRHIKAIAVAQRTTPSAVSDAVEKLFLKLAKQASSGAGGFASPLAHAPSGHRRAGGAGRDVEPAVARRYRREAAE